MREQSKRIALPPHLPYTLINHEPENSHCQYICALKRIGEDAIEKLDYAPGVFTVRCHIPGKWACEQCETLIQAPVPMHVIDKGTPTAGLLSHAMVDKFADHLQLYRQDKVLGLAGWATAACNYSRLRVWVTGRSYVRLPHLPCMIQAGHQPMW